MAGAQLDLEDQEGGGWMRGCEGRWGHCLQEASALKGQAAAFEQSVTGAKCYKSFARKKGSEPGWGGEGELCQQGSCRNEFENHLYFQLHFFPL